MQVATLFREATSLLDAGMEEGSHLKMGGFQDNNVMKAENVHDDGYETAGATDMEISKHPHQHHHQSLNHHHHHNHNMELASSLATHVKEEPMMKYEMPEDPYSFVDDDHMIAPVQCSPMMHQLPKKRGRKKKIKSEDISLHNSMGYQGIMNCLPSHMKEPGMKMVKERKKHDRFNGMPEEEVSKRTLPDHLTQNLDIVIVSNLPIIGYLKYSDLRYIKIKSTSCVVYFKNLHNLDNDAHHFVIPRCLLFDDFVFLCT
uniref:Uncharacterized protein n=1 Tax=Lygus hesperus TaxID=30085 RepID=A0A146LLE1_LYGHE